ncbi:hypothetical protein ACFLWB_02340 [Chloroflexota bacterium]
MERIHRFLREQAIKFSLSGMILVAALLIFGPVLNLLFVEYPEIVTTVSIAILTGVGLLLLDYLSEVKRLIKPQKVTFYPNQEAADTDLRDFILSEKPKQADLLEFSSATVYENIVSPLITSDSNICLLIQNPKVSSERFALSNLQENRICHTLARRLAIERPNYDKIRIRFYKEIASIRGR